ncbi:MAG: hypothetical protein R3A44_09755 [Caldilineaceae bacterium]
MSVMRIDISEIQNRIWELLPLINSGNEVIVTQAEKPVMRLAPIMTQSQKRIAGLHKGMGWMSDDFDAPLPEDFWLGEK